MAYILRNGQLEKAHKIQNLTPEQKTVLKIGTTKQMNKLAEIKQKIQDLKAS